jgi:hypothetical protein
MNRRTKIFIVAGVVITCILTVILWYFYPIYIIKSNVKNSLLDPESSLFSDVEFHRNTGFGCGYVNARNKLGGYVGKKYFVASLEGETVFEPTLESEVTEISEPEVRFPTLTMDFSAAATLAASQRQLQQSLKRLQERQKILLEQENRSANSTAFKVLVSENCSSTNRKKTQVVVSDRCKGSSDAEKCMAFSRDLANETPEQRAKQQSALESARQAAMDEVNRQ